MLETGPEGLTSKDNLVSGAISQSPLSIVLTDPRLEDNPITYVNRAFEVLTLYSREFAIGRNCRFLQGPDTDPGDVDRIREGLRSEREFEVTLLNHRADGSVFRNQLLIAPIHDADGVLTAYFGLQREIPAGKAYPARETDSVALLRELQHRVKNHLALIVSMIRVQSRREVTPQSLRSISRRIEALSVLYDELLAGGMPDTIRQDVSAGAYLGRIASVLTAIQPHPGVRVNVECEDIALPVDQAARLGLLLSEFLTNALEHAFEGRDAGLVDVRFYRLSGGGIRLSVEDDGRGMPAGSNWPFGAPSLEAQRDRAAQEGGALETTGGDARPGVGGSIVAALTDSLGATLSVTRPKHGTIVTVDI
jgi:PAS domain S-box-containing protein